MPPATDTPKLKLHRSAFLSTLLVLAMAVSFFVQNYSRFLYQDEVENFCRYELKEALQKRLYRDQCDQIMMRLDFEFDSATVLDDLAAELSREERRLMLAEYRRMKQFVPDPAEKRWRFDPQQPQLLNTLIYIFAHYSLGQALFNSIFLYIFAAAVERTLGSFGLVSFVALSAVLSARLWLEGVLGLSAQQPLLGLTNIVASCIAFSLVVHPHRFTQMTYRKRSAPLPVPLFVLAMVYLGVVIYAPLSVAVSVEERYLLLLPGAVVGAGIGALLWGMRLLVYLITRHRQ